MLGLEREADLLMGGGGGGQFPGQTGGIKLQLRRSAMRRAVGLILEDRNHTHRVIVFGSRVLGRGVRMRRLLG